MTDAQWLFEAYALRQRERAEAEKQIAVMKMQRQVLISLLGLDMVKQAGGTGEEFVPLSLTCGTPELLAKIFEDAQHEEKATDALNDPDFDAFSEALAKGDMSETDIWPVDQPTEPLIKMTRSPTISFDEEPEPDGPGTNQTPD